MRPLVRSWLGVLVLAAAAAHAQSGVIVEVDDVTDNRVAAGDLRGSLELRVKLDGKDLDKAMAARVLVKEARDDKGTNLADARREPDFTPREYNSGTLQVSVASPARAASTVKLKGTVELFVPARDPGAVVKIDKALAKLDTPFASKGLKAAKIELTPLSVAAYKKALQERKLDATKIAAMREEGKKRGVPEKEIEMMIGLAEALDSVDEPLAEGAVLISGKKQDFDRILRIEILGEDGEPIHIPSRSSSSRGDDTIMTLQPSQPPPPNATLQLHLLTPKSKVSTPFELNVELP